MQMEVVSFVLFTLLLPKDSDGLAGNCYFAMMPYTCQIDDSDSEDLLTKSKTLDHLTTPRNPNLKMIHDYSSMNTSVFAMVRPREMEQDFFSTRKAASLYDPTPIHASRVNVVAKVELTDSVWLEDDEERWLIMSLLKRRTPVMSCMTKKRRVSDCSVVVSAEFKSLATEDEELTSSSEVACSTSSETCCSETKFRKFQSEQWLVRYNDLVDFRAQHGHCLVAKCQDADLAKWVKR
jgi:hypothetical protein